MDLPFQRRVLYYMTDCLLLAMLTYSPSIILASYLFVPYPCRTILLNFLSAPMAGLCVNFFFDPELRSTWSRILCCIFINVTGPLFFDYCLLREIPFELFSNGFQDPETWMLSVVWAFSFIAKSRESLRVSDFNRLLRRAQQRFPDVERTLLLKLTGRAMRSDDPNFIENYEFPAVAG